MGWCTLLPDYPVQKGVIEKGIIAALDEAVRCEPLLSQVPRMRCFEGDAIAGPDVALGDRKRGFESVAAEIQLDRAAIIAKGPKAVVEDLAELAKSFQRQQVEMMLRTLNEACSRSGNTVSSGGRGFTFDVFLEALERVQIDFDRDGKPQLPCVVVGPGVAQTIHAQLPAWEKNPDYKRRFDELIDRKRVEWNDRESDRRLVD